MKEQEPVVPIKKKPTFKKSPLIKYGSNFADQGTGGSKIRTVFKDFDESYEVGTNKKTFKQFREDAGNTKIQTNQDKKNIGFINYLS